MQELEITLREDIYQTYHPFILDCMSRSTSGDSAAHSITLDKERAAFMFHHKIATGERVLDIGANQGFMSIEAALRGAQSVDAFESNHVDGQFLNQAAKSFAELKAMTAHTESYAFEQANTSHWNYVICLNVLHHIGRYFDTHVNSMSEAKMVMAQHLQRLLAKQGCVWLQLGFNWQGNTQQPMFAQGTKREMTDFVVSLLGQSARLSKIGIYDPQGRAYEPVKLGDWGHPLWQRIESVGEFGNRPLYLIESLP